MEDTLGETMFLAPDFPDARHIVVDTDGNKELVVTVYDRDMEPINIQENRENSQNSGREGVAV